MKNIFSGSRLASGVAIWLSLLHFSAEGAEAKPSKETKPTKSENTANPLEEYILKHTVNFNNVSVTEVIRFVSKLTGSNFIFVQNDLNFNVTIVSEEPMSMKNIMAALVQMLRIHGLKLLEEDNNFLITKEATDVNQIPALISPDIQGSDATVSSIVTKIFRIKNANLGALVGILKPLVSASSLLEVFPQTNQLIVTDLITNIDKIGTLISVLDMPGSHLEIESYSLKNLAADQLVSLTEKIVSPFVAGNPFFLIAQKETNTVYVVSTPYLIEKSMTVMEDLDVPAKRAIPGHASVSPWPYKVLHQNPDTLLKDLSSVAQGLVDGVDPALLEALQSAKFLPSTGTIVFTTDAATWDRLQALLAGMDISVSGGKTGFWIYKTRNDNPEALLSALEKLADGIDDPELEKALATVRKIPESGSLVFSGSEATLTKLKEIVPSLDVASPGGEPQVFVYSIEHASESQITSVLSKIASGLGDPGFSRAVEEVQWVKAGNSLIFKAPPDVIRRLQQVLPTIDVAAPETEMLVYKIKKAPKSKLLDALEKIADTTQDGTLGAAIESLHVIPDTSTLIFHAQKPVLQKLESLLDSIDVSSSEQTYVYTIERSSIPNMLDALEQLRGSLQDPDLIKTLDSVKRIDNTNALAFSGSPGSLTELRTLLPILDVTTDRATLYPYKVLSGSEKQVVNALSQMASRSDDKDFVSAIDSMQILEDSHTLLFHTNPKTVEKLKTLLPTLDASATGLHFYRVEGGDEEKIADALERLAKQSEDAVLARALQTKQWFAEARSFGFRTDAETMQKIEKFLGYVAEGKKEQTYIYIVRKGSEKEILASLQKVADASRDEALASAVDTVQIPPGSNTYIFRTDAETVKKLEALLPALDIPSSEVFLYTIQTASKQGFLQALTKGAEGNPSVTEAVRNISWLDGSRTCMFRGSPATLRKIEELCSKIDIASDLEVYTYSPKQDNAPEIVEGLKQAGDALGNSDFSEAVENVQWIEKSKTLLFRAPPSTVALLKKLLPTLDITDSSRASPLLYPLQNGSAPRVIASLKKIGATTGNKALAQAISGVYSVEGTPLLIFHTDPDTFKTLKAILSEIDVRGEVYLYKIESGSKESFYQGLEQTAESSDDPEFTAAVRSMRDIPGSNTVLFSGSPRAIDKLKTVLPALEETSSRKTFVYKVRAGSEKKVREALDLLSSNTDNKAVQDTIKQSNWMESTKSFLFRGPEKAIEELKALLLSLDEKLQGSETYVYTVRSSSPDTVASALQGIAADSSDTEFREAVDTMQIASGGKTLIFRSSPPVIAELKVVLETLDTNSQSKIYIYTISKVSEETLANGLDAASKALHNKEFSAAIRSMQFIPESKTLVFHTTPETIDILQPLLAKLDTDVRNELYLYPVVEASEEEIAPSLQKIGETTSDTELAKTIAGMQWMEKSRTLVFSGTHESIEKLKKLLPSIDISAMKTYPYRIRSVGAEHMDASLDKAAKTIGDGRVARALTGRERVNGGKTYLFKTTPEVWAELQVLLPMLDAERSDEELFLYPIHSVNEERLALDMKTAAKASGNADLIDAVEGMQWIETSKTLVFSASPATITRLQSLLATLDKAADPVTTYMYKLQNSSEEQMSSSLAKLASTVPDPALKEALEQVQKLPDGKTFIFHAKASTIAKLEALLPKLDAVGTEKKLYTYTVRNVKVSSVITGLEQAADALQNSEMSEAIERMQTIGDGSTLVFRASPDTLAKIEMLLTKLDTPSGLQTYSYKTHSSDPAALSALLEQTVLRSQDKDLIEALRSMTWIPDTKTFVFQGSPAAIAQLEKVLPSLDKAKPKELYVYKVRYASPQSLVSSLERMSLVKQDPDFAEALETVHVEENNRSLIFHTTSDTIAKLQTLLSSLDVAKPQMLMYTVKTASPEQIASALDKMAQTLQNKDLIEAIRSLRWIEESHAFVFNGSAEAVAELQTLLAALDSATPPALSAASSKGQFLLYTPKYARGEDLRTTLTELCDNLKSSGLQNGNLTTALESMKWVPSSNSLVFTGDAASLEKIKSILTDIDIAPGAAVTTFVYKPVYASEYQLQNALTRYAQNLDPENPDDALLAKTIREGRLSSDETSFVFKGDPGTLAKLKSALAFLDSPQGLATIKTTNFSLYKLQYAQGDVIIKNLMTLIDTLPTNDPNTASLVRSIRDLHWVKESNALMITGSPYTIDQIKVFIGQFDTPTAAAQTAAIPKGDFWIYKPMNKTPEEVRESLTTLCKDLAASPLADPGVLTALQTVKIVPASKSLLFTAAPDTLNKLKPLVTSVDTASDNDTRIEILGASTFLIYKIKQAPHDDLIRSLQNFAAELNRSDVQDQTLAKSLGSVTWIKETNSLFFTGSQETLKRVEALAEKFDLAANKPPEAPRETPATFVVYSPQLQSGADLIGILHDFMQSLIRSGISDPALFDAISHLKFIEKTNSLIISGDLESIKKIQELLTKFDVAPKEGEKPQLGPTNFLVYKLQYHQGADIQDALKKIAVSLEQTAPDVNRGLIDAIASLQWLEVTNSLLITGEPAVLDRLRQLIISVDVPLRQVFIEVLVVETSLFNSQNFGLQWGSQFQYMNKTIGAMGNFPTIVNNNFNSGNQPSGTVTLANPISYTTNTNSPVQGNPLSSTTAVPFATGFDLGVIGDIIFHKGQSFISLGSLLNALQVDRDSTVIMNPKIITQDGHTSSIFVGQNIPFVGSFVSNTASNTVQSSNIEYRDVGVNLVITPTLGTNNVITLDISQDISEQSPNTTAVQGSQVTGIQTSHTTMHTRVHVPDRHFLVLSGMIQDTKNHFSSSIPCLGGLPVIGALFSENDRTNSKANVIIFLRPFIIDSFKDYDLLTADEEALYKQQAGLQDLKEEFDAGPEMIKNLHNE